MIGATVWQTEGSKRHRCLVECTKLVGTAIAQIGGFKAKAVRACWARLLRDCNRIGMGELRHEEQR